MRGLSILKLPAAFLPMSEIQSLIESVKSAKAELLYWQDVQAYGGEGAALRALDCASREEAIHMLAAVQKVTVFKYEGKLVVQ